jgi:hypothetical protein
MKVILWLTVVLGGAFLALAHKHYEKYGHINVQAQAIVLFLLINILICYWELALCYCYDYINKTHAKRLKSGYYTQKMASKRDPIIIMQVMKAHLCLVHRLFGGLDICFTGCCPCPSTASAT